MALRQVPNKLTPEAYSDVFERLERGRVRYVVIGSAAVVLRGHDRPVADLDLAVGSPPDERGRAVSVLSGLGFVASVPLPLGVLTVLRMFDRSQREVDVFFRPRIPFAELWAGSELVRLGRGVARVTSLEHLLRVKRMDGTRRDLSDIEGLLGRGAGGRGRDVAATLVGGRRDVTGEEAV